MKCKVCGQEFPSKYYFKIDMICLNCFEKLPEEQKKPIKDKEKAEQLANKEARKHFSIGFALGLAAALIFQFVVAPFQLAIAPLIGGFFVRKPWRGAQVGFVTLFVYTFIFIIVSSASGLFKSGAISSISSIISNRLPTGTAAIIIAPLLGLGFGIWPGAVMGLIGGFFGKIFLKRS